VSTLDEDKVIIDKGCLWRGEDKQALGIILGDLFNELNDD
jgi:hypothetical protein